jgi:NusA-like KH domain protein
MAIINMQTMRYINLLDSASRVKTSKCFVYNNIVYFAVPREKISRAIGPNASNVKILQNKIGKKVRIIRQAESKEEAERFIKDVVAPVSFKSIEISNGQIIITAGSNQSKASLIGRDKRRLLELAKVVKDSFNVELRVV